VIVFAGLTFQQVTVLAAHEPAPYLGLIERVNIYAWMLWVAVLSMSLWHGQTASRSDVGMKSVVATDHVVVASRAPDLRMMWFFNPVIRALLRSLFHGLLSGQILLLTYTGRRSPCSFAGSG
jgi:hypothetical protein